MTNEVGRSMVETLGMLAIVGILSVVGMRGYTSAMDKSKANNLIQEAQKRAVIVAGQIGFNNQTPNLSEFNPPNTTSGGTIGDVTTEGLYKQFGIKVSGVKKRICENILQTIGKSTPIRRLSKEGTPTTAITSCEDENAFLFIYNNDMTANDTVALPKSCRTVNDCASACATCEIPEEEELGICTNECEEPVKLCKVNTDCNTENECMMCDTEAGLCKNGCERVEYLESTGSQWIDTGVVMQYGDEYVCDFEITNLNDSSYLGGYLLASVNSYDLHGRSYALGWFRQTYQTWYNFLVGFNDATWYTQDRTPYPTIGTRYRTRSVITLGDIRFYVNGDFAFKDTYTTTSTNNRPLFMFARNSQGTANGFGKVKAYRIQMKRNGTLVRDFVPVLSPETSQYAGKACMFNRVPDENGKLKLYCDANNGTFKTNKDEDS